jgi:radical SAM superfamily enzyme YgiQ (UPF0313 family)
MQLLADECSHLKLALVHGKYFNSWEALGLGYIGAYVASHVPDIELSFMQGCFDDDDTIVSTCAAANIVAFSCTSPSFAHAASIARKVKAINPNVWTVVGGYHVSALQTECLGKGIDQIVIGEGEAAMLEIVKGNRDPVVRGRIMEFRELAWPDRQLIRNDRNIAVAFNENGKRITSFQSHRACPFMCRYCCDGFNKVLYGNVRKAPMRYRPVSDLLDEIATVSEDYQLDLVKFADPTWNTNIDWVMEYCKEKIARNLSIPFYPNIHAAMCSEEMFDLMARAGCYEVAIGVESGSPRILKQIGKGTTVETIRRCVRWAKKAGILCRGYFIVGMPDETDDDLRRTEEFADELDLDEYGFTLLCPYPGTAMYDPVKFKDVDWEQADEYSNDFWNGSALSNAEFKAWQQRLATRFSKKLTWHHRVLGHGVA